MSVYFTQSSCGRAALEALTDKLIFLNYAEINVVLTWADHVISAACRLLRRLRALQSG